MAAQLEIVRDYETKKYCLRLTNDKERQAAMVLTDSEAKFLISAIRELWEDKNPLHPRTWTFPTMEPTREFPG